jgi:hypothetical protein
MRPPARPREWLLIAQAFAGQAGAGRQLGQFTQGVWRAHDMTRIMPLAGGLPPAAEQPARLIR